MNFVDLVGEIGQRMVNECHDSKACIMGGELVGTHGHEANLKFTCS